MKKNIISIVLLLLSMGAFATGQEGDIVYINDTLWTVLGKPIDYDSVYFSLKAALPEDHSHSTANWDGYTAYWSIVQDELCLDSICCDFYNKETQKFYKKPLPTDTLLRIFRKFYDGKRIVARWLNGNWRMGRGHLVYYEHTYYVRNYEDEQVINFQQGRVTDSKSYHNYYNKGLSFDQNFRPTAFVGNSEAIRKLFPLHTERYRNLKNVEVIRFVVKDAEIDTTGHMVSCKVEATLEYKNDKKKKKKKNHPAIAAEMEELMKAYYPWRVYYINGEYRFTRIKGKLIPYKIEPENKD
jgi:hypothetical protein